MKRKWMVLAACAALLTATTSDACTSFLVGKKASADGSVMITYAADSHNLYGELYHWPAAKWPKGSMLEIREWDSNKPLGKIPQVEETYNVVGNMNEHQVAITESTFGGRPELEDSTGIMDYGSLIYVALQRAKSAREAIHIMTSLVKEHGYYSSGESFSIADKNEAWIMEMIGKGVGNKGAVWVAIRIPDDCISAHANQSRIQQIPFDDKENCMYSPDVVSFAREKGYFNGKDKDFSFTKAYCPYDFSALRGCEARVWAFMRKYDKSLDAYLPFLKGESDKPMPLYVKADRKLTLQDVKNGMRDHYEGTEFCMTNDAGMGPYKVPYRWRPMTFKVDGQEYVNERAIATQQTGFVLCAQLRNWLPDAIGGVLWFGVDDAATAVFTPMYGSIKETPECFRVGNGDMMTFSWTSAFWIHNWVANMAYSKYSFMIEDIKPVQKELELGFEAMQPSIDKAAADMYAKNPEEAVKFLTWYSTTEANRSTARWKQLGEYLVVKYIDGNVKKEVNGKFMQNGYGLSASPNFPGYDETYYRSIVNSAGERLKVK
ncbi:MAG: C69 family dipeptidase [Parabacteroides sp.]|jgi:dipeptidase|nr:C69 family dipeptidase [Parabacteroides chartae]MBP7919422.1 C69 family dipeptidase [Parabacteroides sp.]MDT3368154.1 C69 family dipeptidase [Bacteroidota bacterium]HNP90156.1 C69 family dipeptidase [Macellibacteroides fermentans]MBP7955033.1 C69 family dipeptidase [Parabacteroides sp.]MBP8011854.1 C69 family dipeptidase [Parabacteroides sp.]